MSWLTTVNKFTICRKDICQVMENVLILECVHVKRFISLTHPNRVTPIVAVPQTKRLAMDPSCVSVLCQSSTTSILWLP